MIDIHVVYIGTVHEKSQCSKGFLVYHVANIILLLLAQTVFNEWVFLSVLAGCFCFCSSLAALTMMSRTFGTLA